jgi:hypothetical protein
MIYIGLSIIAISSAAFVAEVYPTVKRWWKKPYVRRTGRKVKTTIVRKENR